MPISPLRFGTFIYSNIPIPTNVIPANKAHFETESAKLDFMEPLAEEVVVNNNTLAAGSPLIRIYTNNSILGVQPPTCFITGWRAMDRTYSTMDDSTLVCHVKGSNPTQEDQMAKLFESLLTQRGITFTKTYRSY